MATPRRIPTNFCALLEKTNMDCVTRSHYQRRVVNDDQLKEYSSWTSEHTCTYIMYILLPAVASQDRLAGSVIF